MTKELTVKTAAGLQVYTPPGLVGVAANISSSDIQIPTLMLMQSNSTFVEENDNINSGDFIHSITMDCWGKKDSDPVDLIFFDMFKTQVVSDVTDRKKWVASLPWQPDMELDPYEQLEKDKLIRREKCFNYICFRSLEVVELANPVNGEILYTASPIVIKFKGGSLKNGKRLNQVFQDMATFEAPSWALRFNLTARHEENEKGKYWAYDFKKGVQSPMEMQSAAAKLCQQFQTAKRNMVVIDHEEGAPKNVTPVPNHAPKSGGIV